MRNLNGYLNKTLLLSSILLCLFPFFFTSKIYSADDLSVSSSFEHYWDGTTLSSTIYLVLSTKSSSTVVTYYTVTIPQTDISPTIFSVNRNSRLEPTIHKDNINTNLVIDLKNTPIYPNKPVTLKIEYQKVIEGNTVSMVSSIANTTTDNFQLEYPTSLGDISWSSVAVLEKEVKENTTLLKTDIPNTQLVKFSFGSNVIYKYTINKNITNVGDETRISELTLPLNNSTQHILVTSITPQPDKTYKDIEGNYILQYSVIPDGSIDVNIQGYILMNKTDYPYTHTLTIEESNIWKITNTSLIRHVNRYIKSYGLDIAETFADVNTLENTEQKELLYKAIYNYVIENLQPNTLTIGSLTGSERLGGQEILITQGESTSEDYVDSIISLYRHFNIPARYVIGYITNISNYDSEGMYHYWAEYYDKDKNDWIVVEPFLEDYSKTVLYNKDMKDHVALIYRYYNPYSPNINFFSSEELQIEPVDEELEVVHDVELDLIFQPYKISDPYLVGYINIKNIGNTVLDMFSLSKSKPNLSKYIDYIENNTQIILLPNQTYDLKFNIPYSDIQKNMYVFMNVLSGTEEINDIYVEKDIEFVEEYTNLKIFSKLISILLYILISIPIYFISKRVKYSNG